MGDYQLRVPEIVYLRAREIARETSQTVEQVMLSHLETLPFTLPALAPEEEAELAALHHLSDDALWTIAHEQLPAQKQKQLEKLMMRHSRGALSTDELAVLAQFVERGERLMLRKSEAMAILSQRGHRVKPNELTNAV